MSSPGQVYTDSSERARQEGARSNRSGDSDGDDAAPTKRTGRRSTSHLKAVPETLAARDKMKADCDRFMQSIDRSQAFTKDELEIFGQRFLEEHALPEKYLGFVMVLLGNSFWKRQFLAVPFEKRLLLLPHCLKHAEGCPAEYDEFGLDCEKCGACSIADYKVRAEQLGYKVLVAEGSPIVLKIIVEGYVDGILGVACLNVLEKAIDKVLLAGVPSFAVPLHSGDCKNTSLDESWVWDVLDKYEPLDQPQTTTYIPLMRASNRMFKEDFPRLLPRVRSKDPEKTKTPLAITEDVAYDWLANGGKRFRPFITLAAFHARSSGAILRTDVEHPVSDSVARVAMAIEAFHKASLVHDDIQDNDLYRYGRETVHRTMGIGPAINVGDYLIGLGYRLVNSCRGDLGADVACDILDSMATAHIRLCDGQGAEMAWQRNPDWTLSPLDALQIYALKTSPAFEAALYAGLRMAGPMEPYAEMVSQFCRQVGVGFQILNDLKDWAGDKDNKLVAGQDALALRPTVLLALAMQSATPEQRKEVASILQSDGDSLARLSRLRRIFSATGAFEKAQSLIEKSRERAEALADATEPVALRQLLYFFIDTVLAPETDSGPPEADAMPMSLPVVNHAPQLAAR
ncbi:polyprenyl synthetase family protein [Planctomyces sp. SH-PL14]|uniref:polyprenyl synthetase family protein n=1 Tax=Planctomyces sp. SH-PL14 TaxID=1632864 RepID=UPI00078C64D2|nr:polyprenyl synthetase family protein [Planctomyces sp. SH-PL14]AMV21481.1 All-trans-nonaprenyl-diphosphate synthase (geranyl-diphosphate specific) [Planctomyces sp. SH-PL14]